MAATTSWTTIFLIALAITAAIVVYSQTVSEAKSPTGHADFTMRNILWTYAGVFTAVAVIVGMVDMMQHGYGVGDIF
jgi:cell division protein FtsW (lipid II flippase)